MLDAFAAKKIVGALLLPPTGPLLIALCGLLLMLVPRSRRGSHRSSRRLRRYGESAIVVGQRRWPGWLGMLLILFGVGSALALTSWPVARHLPNWLESPYIALNPDTARLPTPAQLAAWKGNPKTAPQAIVMLTAGASPDGDDSDRDRRLAPDTAERALHTARLARLTGLPILVSGGRVRPARASLAEMAREMIEKDLGQPVRWAETRSRDTPENAALSATLLKAAGIERILLVSHATHMRRSVGLFRRQSFEVTPAPCCFIGKSQASAWQWFWPTGDALYASYVSAHEVLGLLWYQVSGWPGSTKAR